MTKTEKENAKRWKRRSARECLAMVRAREENKSMVYIDDDGCEVTVTPQGAVFFNVSDWW
jgi:hypothetical protein